MDRTVEAVNSQIAAMGVQVFEVGLFKPGANSHGQAVMIPRTWDVDSAVKSIPWLRLQNAEGRNIHNTRAASIILAWWMISTPKRFGA